eukprot:ANDGO_04064.mRNA.1 Thermosome subunit beta
MDQSLAALSASLDALLSFLSPSFGPFARSKLLYVKKLDKFVYSADGSTIASSLFIQNSHPCISLILETARTVQEHAGDGTTSLVLLCSSILKSCVNLVRQGHAKSDVIAQLRLLQESCLHALDSVAFSVAADEHDIKNAACQCLRDMLQTKVGVDGRVVSDMLIHALFSSRVASVDDDGSVDDDIMQRIDRIGIVAADGAAAASSAVFDGVMVAGVDVGPPLNSAAPNAADFRVCLISDDIEFRRTNNYAVASSSMEMLSLESTKSLYLSLLASHMTKLGISAVFCSGQVSRVTAYHLRKAGVRIVRERVPKPQLRRLADLCKCTIRAMVEDLSPRDVGLFKTASMVDLGNSTFLQCTSPLTPGPATCAGFRSFKTLVIRGFSQQTLEETERLVQYSLHYLKSCIQSAFRAVSGAGIAELQVHSRVIKADASDLTVSLMSSFLSIPRTLRANFDPSDIDTYLSNLLAEVSDGRQSTSVVDAYVVKHCVIQSAFQTAMDIFSVNEWVMASRDAPALSMFNPKK